MAHNIAFDNEGRAMFATVREKAWHGLGTVVPEAMTQEEVIRLTGLDYEVKVDEFTYRDKKSGKWRVIANTMNDKILGVVKGRYTPIQNIDGFKFFESFVQQSEAIYETAGVLQDGAIAWIMAKLPSHIEVNGDVCDLYVVVMLFHNGRNATVVGFTPVRVVCNNTLNAALSNMADSVRINHRGGHEAQLREASRLLGIRNAYEAAITDAFRDIADARIGNDTAYEFFGKVVTKSRNFAPGVELSTKAANRIEELMDYYQYHETQANVYGTLWGAYNAVTGFYQNVREYRDSEHQFTNTFVGGDAKTYNTLAFALANEMAQ